jgi:phosphoserine phosphatase RsbU/P
MSVPNEGITSSPADDPHKEIERLTKELQMAEEEIELGLASVSDLYEELAALYRMGDLFTHTTDRNEFIRVVMQLVADTVECDCALTLLPVAGDDEKDKENKGLFTWGPCWEIEPEEGEIVVGDEESFLNHCLKQSNSLIMNDFSEDERYDSPLCRRLGLERILVSGFDSTSNPGLIVLGRRKNSTMFTAGNAKLQTSLTTMLTNQLENDRLRQKELERHRMEEQLEIARHIQRSLLPKEAPVHELFDASGRNTMARQVGGDYYQFHDFGDGRYGIMVADVSGKGVPASLLMTMVKGVLTGLPISSMTPGEVLGQLNRVVYNEELADRFITMAFTVCDPNQQSMTYASAGHEPLQHLIFSQNRIQEHRSKDFPLGLVPDMTPQDITVPFNYGDTVVLMSDGVIEARNSEGKFFEESRMLGIMQQCFGLSSGMLCDKIVGAVQSFVKGEDNFDDLTIAALHLKEKQD